MPVLELNINGLVKYGLLGVAASEFEKLLGGPDVSTELETSAWAQAFLTLQMRKLELRAIRR